MEKLLSWPIRSSAGRARRAERRRLLSRRAIGMAAGRRRRMMIGFSGCRRADQQRHPEERFREVIQRSAFASHPEERQRRRILSLAAVPTAVARKRSFVAPLLRMTPRGSTQVVSWCCRYSVVTGLGSREPAHTYPRDGALAMSNGSESARTVRQPWSDRWLLDTMRERGHPLAVDVQAAPSAWEALEAAGIPTDEITRLVCEVAGAKPADVSRLGPEDADMLSVALAGRYDVVAVRLDGANARSWPPRTHSAATSSAISRSRARAMSASASRRLPPFGTHARAFLSSLATPAESGPVVMGHTEERADAGGGADARRCGGDDRPHCGRRDRPARERHPPRAARRRTARTVPGRRCAARRHARPGRGDTAAFESPQGWRWTRHRGSTAPTRRSRVDDFRRAPDRPSHFDVAAGRARREGSHSNPRCVRDNTRLCRARDLPTTSRLSSRTSSPAVKAWCWSPGRPDLGKTTTLYWALLHMKSHETNIVTVEDPIEYRLEGVNQVQVNEKARLTFASALRSILRQDIDIITRWRSPGRRDGRNRHSRQHDWARGAVDESPPSTRRAPSAVSPTWVST